MYRRANRKIITAIFFLAGLVMVTITGCYKDKEEILYPGSTAALDCTTVPAKFAADVQPVFTTKCAIAGCHDATASGGKIFQSYNQVNESKERINVRALVEKTMPPTGALSPPEVNKIKCWIEGGAVND